MTTAALSQSQFRGRSDANSVDTAATFIAAVNTNWTQLTATPFRVRFTIQETAGGNPNAATVTLQSSRNGGTFQSVTTSSTNVIAVTTASSSADETAIAVKQLTGTGTFINGVYDASGTTTTSVDMSASSCTEYEFGIQLVTANLAGGDTIALKVVAVSGTAITATVSPSITVNLAPAITGVAGTGGVGTVTASFPINRPGLLGAQANSAPSNWVTNPLGSGGTPGTINGGGVMPTGWSASSGNGLAWEFSVGATYVVNGLSVPTVRMRLHGTTSNSAAASLSYQTGTTFTGLMYGQTGCQSSYVAIVAGNTTNIAVNGIAHWGRIQNSASSVVVDNQPPAAFTSSFAQYSTTTTMPSSGSAPFSWLSPGFVFDPTGTGVAIDITIDVGAPQLVFGSSPFSLQPISATVSPKLTGASTTCSATSLTAGAFHRPSTATYLDAGGNLISVGVDVLRPKYSGSTLTDALIEGFSANIITNPRIEGAVAGSPGTQPTNWSIDTQSGLTRTLSTGVENGIPYIDVRYNGTTSAVALTLNFDGGLIAALPAQTLTESVYLTLSSGSLTNITDILLVQQYYNSTPAFINANTVAMTPISASLSSQRFTLTATTVALTAYILPYIKIEFSIGVAIDLTLRIGGPQLEPGSSATSVILPPVGSPAVSIRAPDTVGYARPSTATYFDYDSILQSAVSNFLRPSYTSGNQTGNLIESVATNFTTNNTMVGAVTGTPGTDPTGWNINFGTVTGLSKQIVGLPVVNGIQCIDVRYFGTATTGNLFPNTGGSATALVGSVWNVSGYLALVGGTLTNVNAFFLVANFDFAGNTGVALTPTATFTRYSGSNTAASGNTTVGPVFCNIGITAGAVDFTLRFGAPQLELGSAATSIITTSGSAVTRAADNFAYLRASSATYFDYAGTLTTAVSDFLRPTYSASGNLTGNLIEAAATNSLRNNTMVGAVVGTPGTLPTNWAYNGSSQGTIAGSVVGQSTSNGISYVDIRFNGTSSGSGFYQVFFETSTGIAASVGQTWTISSYLTIVSGSTANITAIQFGQNENSIVPAFLTSGVSTIVVGSGSLSTQRYSYTYTTTNGSTAFIDPLYSISFGSGAVVDITIRVGMPQMERGSAATSVITTSGSTVIRAADIATSGLVSDFANLTGASTTCSAGTLVIPTNASQALTGVATYPLAGSFIGKPLIVPIASGSGKGVTSVVLTLPANIPAGCTIFVASSTLGATGPNVSDSFGQVNWVGGNGTSTATVTNILDWAWNASGMNAGNTITVSAQSGTFTCAATAFYVTGVYAGANPFDATQSSSGTGTSPTATTGSLAQIGELVIGSVAVASASTDAFTQDTAYGATLRSGTTGGTDTTIDVCAKFVTATTGQTYAPTLGTSAAYAEYVATFKLVTSPSLNLLGAASTASAGTLTPTLPFTVNLTGASMTGSPGTFSIRLDQSPALTGASMTGSPGTLSIRLDDSANLTGASMTGSPGTLSIRLDKSVNLTGAAATGAASAPTAKLDIAIAGVAGTGSAGTLTPSYNTSVNLTGVAITSAPGTFSVSIVSGSTVNLVGVAITCSPGTLTSQIDHINLAGVAITAAPGTLTGNPRISLNGLAITGSPGTFSLQISPNINLVGVAITGSPGTIAASVFKTLTGAAITSSPGTIAASVFKTLTGVAITASAGTVVGNVLPLLTGAVATGHPGGLTVRFNQSALDGAVSTLSPGVFTVTKFPDLLGVASTLSPGTFGIGKGVNLPGAVIYAVYGWLKAPQTPDIELPTVSARASPGSFGVSESISRTLPSATSAARAGALIDSLLVTLNGVSTAAHPGAFYTIITGIGMTLADLMVVCDPPVDDSRFVSLRWSDSRGQHFGNAVLQTLGDEGDYLANMQWRRLGMGRDRIFEVSWTVPAETAITGAFIDVETASS